MEKQAANKGKKHFTEKDRYTLEKLLKAKKKVSEIVNILGFSKVSIYAEIKRGTVIQRDSLLNEKKVYLADAGQRESDKAKENMGRPIKLAKDDEFLEEIKYWVKEQKYSPEAALYKTENKKVCKGTLYNYIKSDYIDGLTIYSLPYAKPKKKKKKPETKRKYSKGKSIEDRPEEILERNEYGHWELDTVYSSRDDKSALMVLTERMTREEIIIKTPDRTSESMVKAFDRLEKQMGAPAFRETFKTITCDNGVEFSNWEAIEKSKLNKGKRTDLYFCHPYSSYERGTNENNNRPIRRWIPKGDDIGLYSKKEIQQIQDWMNNYPRKILGGLSSNEYKKVVLGIN